MSESSPQYAYYRMAGECRCGREVAALAKRKTNPRAIYIRCRECGHIVWADSGEAIDWDIQEGESGEVQTHE